MKIRGVFGKRDSTEFVYGHTGSRTIGLTLYKDNLYYLLFLHSKVSEKVCASTGIVYFRYFRGLLRQGLPLTPSKSLYSPSTPEIHSGDGTFTTTTILLNSMLLLAFGSNSCLSSKHTLYYIQLLEKPREHTANHLANNNVYISRRILSQSLQL